MAGPLSKRERFSTLGVPRLPGRGKKQPKGATPNLLERCTELLQPVSKLLDRELITHT